MLKLKNLEVYQRTRELTAETTLKRRFNVQFRATVQLTSSSSYVFLILGSPICLTCLPPTPSPFSQDYAVLNRCKLEKEKKEVREK